MAATENTPFPTSASMSMNSFETALCIIPPAHKCRDIENLRELYDKGYGKWPPHLNLVYPFVAPQNLDRACAKIKSHLNYHDVKETLLVNLGEAGLFEHHNDSTIFLRDSQNPEHGSLASLRTTILKALGQEPTPCNFHLTIGQSESNSESSKSFLLAKARFLPKLEFQVHTIAILVRERGANQGGATGRMKLWGNIDVSDATPRRSATPPEFWISPLELHKDQRQFEGEYDDDEVIQEMTKFSGREVQSGETYKFQSSTSKWAVTYGNDQKDLSPTCVAVSSYNVLAESVCPAPRHRDPLLLEILTSKSASADIAVLQEVSDEFLSYLLDNEEVRRKYPFVSHAPPSQSDIGPLPSLRNIVMLSKWYFDWVSVPFHRRHKGAIVATFPNVIKLGTGATLPLVVAGIHLTSGLTDGSVAAKKVQLQCLTNYLSQNHGDKPWIIPGDFNLTTSSSTIETAIQNRSISPQSLATLTTIEHSLTEAGLLDAWSVTRVEGTDEMLPWDSDDLFEGEEGATFNPRENALAATASGTSNNRPQRYDRVLVRPQDVIQIRRFNYFGFPETRDGTEMVASDHVGIRALMQLMPTSSQPPAYDSDILKRNSVQLQGLKGKFSSASELSSTLTSHGMFPTKEEVQHRQEAFEIIKKVLLGLNNNEESTTANIPMIVVPVGSYALGVWTSASDIDCLCIGSISPKTFFSLARQRINKAENHGVRLLRKVEANTGTMFELSVAGVNMDLQYCPAARVVESWPNFHELPSSDPVFNLPILSLRKLKPYRDISYIQRTLPSLPAFRLAYRCIKLWAVQRGLYSSRFGYLGGVHITLLLSWVCKRLAHDGHTINAPDLVASFFHHYAHFDWAGDMVFDVFFHKKKPRYSRTSREPMVVLGFHAPNANIAYTGTVAGLQTLVKEFKAAAARLSDPNMTWNEFFEPNGTLEPLQMSRAAAEFLEVHDSYVMIDIQYWGRTLSMGKSLVGWVESRCLLLVVDLQKSLSNIEVRIWPERFTDTDQYSSESSDYHGCYLIGLSKSSSSEIGANKEDRHLARQTLDKLLDRFLTQFQADEKHHDPTSSWIGISLAKTSDVKNMRLDDREWGDYVADLDPDSDDDEDLFVPDEADDNATERKVTIRTKASSSGPVSTAKLRPASDVLNRLRWDPNLDPSDYVIGYEDRFLGVKETTLERWKTEQTDEEFIPQHRILYFKTKAEGVIVWDRARRIDGIFGSGVGAGDGGGEGRTHVN